MSENSVDLNALLFGGGGAIAALGAAGSYVAYVVKKELDVKNERISSLKETITRRDQELDEISKEKEKLEENFIKALDEAFQGTNGQTQIQALLKRFQEVTDPSSDLIQDYKAAAKWLQTQKIEWAKLGYKNALNTYKRLVPRPKRNQFQNDLAEYLNWVHKSLDFYQHTKIPLKKYVETPAISDPTPYIAAIAAIKEEKDWGVLTHTQSQHISRYLDALIDKLRYRN